MLLLLAPLISWDLLATDPVTRFAATSIVPDNETDDCAWAEADTPNTQSSSRDFFK